MAIWHNPLVCAFVLQHASQLRPRFADGQFRFLQLFIGQGIQAVNAVARRTTARNRGRRPNLAPAELAAYAPLLITGFPAGFDLGVHHLREADGEFRHLRLPGIRPADAPVRPGDRGRLGCPEQGQVTAGGPAGNSPAPGAGANWSNRCQHGGGLHCGSARESAGTFLLAQPRKWPVTWRPWTMEPFGAGSSLATIAIVTRTGQSGCSPTDCRTGPAVW